MVLKNSFACFACLRSRSCRTCAVSRLFLLAVMCCSVLRGVSCQALALEMRLGKLSTDLSGAKSASAVRLLYNDYFFFTGGEGR